MITGLKPKRLLYRDGTGQSQRMMTSLDPAYVSIEERNIADLLRFAQEYAKRLVFFDNENDPAGTWESFLTEDSALPADWISDIVTYIDDPERFTGDPEKVRKLSRPHLILFISFLQLLGHIKDQLNGFTKKHLDFYYLQILALSKKPQVPDVVNVIIELIDEADGLLIEKGTQLLAGKDSLGKDLVYETDNHTVISQAKIESIKTLFVEKKITNIEQAQKNNIKDADKGFLKMLQLAVGDPEPGDKLPVDDASGVVPDFENAPKNYYEKKLFLSDDQFSFLNLLLQNIKSGISVDDVEWQKAYLYLDDAYKKKIIWKRQQVLKQKLEEGNDKQRGLVNMLKLALGDPNPLDDLPLFQGQPITFAILQKISDAPDEAAIKYLKDELLLSQQDFIMIIEAVKQSDQNTSWEPVFVAVEIAQRKKRNFLLPSPFKEELQNVYSIADARGGAFSLNGEVGESSKRFNTFGKGASAGELINVKPANIGFAVSSPQLILNEGKRTINVTISFKKDVAIRVEEIKNILAGLPQNRQPFLFFLSNSKEWKTINATSVSYGNFIVNGSGEEIKNATINQSNKTISGGNNFNANDIGKYIVTTDGSIFYIQSLIDNGAVILGAGKVENAPKVVRKYNSEDIYFNAIHVQLDLNENDVPVNAPATSNDFITIKSTWPVLAIVLDQIPLLKEGQVVMENGKEKNINIYHQLKDLQLDTVFVKVKVDNIKTLVLQNDSSVLDHKKPFEPFGYLPQTGNSLYFTHSELATKQLETLSLSLDWMKPTNNFHAYYANYWNIKNEDKKVEITNNSSFQADVKLADNNAVIPLQTVSLFNEENESQEKLIDLQIDKILEGNAFYKYERDPSALPAEEVLNSPRYFSLELGSPDFQHSVYPTLLTKQAFLDVNDPLRKHVLDPPYTPKLKSVTAGYTASFQINVTDGTANKDDSIFHINTFGYKQIEIDKSVDQKIHFLPYFNNEGELYLGFDKLAAPQTLSVLFQMAEGSGDPDIAPMPVTWNYLSDNKWQQIKDDNIVSDTTNGLLNTGIIQFNIPSAATNNNTLLSDSLHWLQATVSSNVNAISDTVNIFAQGISAIFTDNENAADHLVTPLQPGSIKQTVANIPQIKKIQQPYTSSKGRPAEVDGFFYNRVSERLRHKDRAVAMWDYERLVLEQFPEIYKVKCNPAEFSGDPADTGRVDLIVIPDIKGNLPFDPFQPKVPANTILEIQQFLEKLSSPYAIVKVRNPSYLQVKTRFALKIREGYSEGFYIKKLQEELKRFLAPWAYDEGADIVLGGKIYASVIVNFIAERPYVNYVAVMKLFQSEDGIVFTDAATINKGENFIQAGSPNVILVSALEHDIDIIMKEGFLEENFTGINYMRIELDFKVG